MLYFLFLAHAGEVSGYVLQTHVLPVSNVEPVT